MKCNIGDKVRFLNDIGGGTVVGFVDRTTAIVRDDDGFEIPTLLAELIVVDDSDDTKSSKKNQSSRVEAPAKNTVFAKTQVVDEDIEVENDNKANNSKLTTQDEDGNEFEISLGFLPVEADKPTDSDLQVYIINDSTYRIFYTLSRWQKNGKMLLLGKGELEGDCKEFVFALKKSELTAPQNLRINFVLYKNIEYTLQATQEIDYEINPVKFFKNGNFAENDYFEQKAYIYILASSRKALRDYIDNISPDEIAKAMKQKKSNSPQMPKLKQNVEIEEVDLHIEALVENHEGMSNGEMLKLQVDRFTTALDLGIAAKTKRMVFIHGVGNGKLKHEVRRLLDTQYAGKVRYQDASFKEYGYGATMVYIK